MHTNLFDPKTFGKRVEAALIYSDISRRALAKLVGVGNDTINRVAQGKTPSIETYLRLNKWMDSLITPSDPAPKPGERVLPKGKSKSKFWWASVAGAACEPMEVTTLNGERVGYTCGCGDPFYLDRPDCPVLLVPTYAVRDNGLSSDGPMVRELTPKLKEALLRKQRRDAAAMKAHSWRGPR